MDCYAGSSTGTLKAIDFGVGKVDNHYPTGGLDELVPEQHEITAMCYYDEDSQVCWVDHDRLLLVTNNFLFLFRKQW